MRDFTRDHRALSINTATVRKQGDLVAIAEACARAEIKAISPWRDQVAAVGLNRAVAAVKDAGLEGNAPRLVESEKSWPSILLTANPITAENVDSTAFWANTFKKK